MFKTNKTTRRACREAGAGPIEYNCIADDLDICLDRLRETREYLLNASYDYYSDELVKWRFDLLEKIETILKSN